MFGGKKKGSNTTREMDEAQAHLKVLFEKSPNEIHLLQSTSTDKNDLFSHASKIFILSNRELTPKIISHEFYINHKETNQLKALADGPGKFGKEANKEKRK